MIDIIEIDLDIDGNVMPAKHEKIGLVDADTIAYTACLNTEVAEEVLPEHMYTEMEWDAIVNDRHYDADNEVLYTCNIDLAVQKAEEKMQRILDKTGCKFLELHFSYGRNNFRYEVNPEYKANRNGMRPPAGLAEVKEALAEKYNGIIHTRYEADDAVVKLMDHDKYVLCAVDKDVLNSVPGRNFNYYESAAYNIEMKWVEVSETTARQWKYLQTLMGDKTDNVIGLKGIGPKKAEKILEGLETDKEMWQAVVAAYEKAGRTEDEAIMNLNLVDMTLVQADNTIKLHTKESLNE